MEVAKERDISLHLLHLSVQDRSQTAVGVSGFVVWCERGIIYSSSAENGSGGETDHSDCARLLKVHIVIVRFSVVSDVFRLSPKCNRGFFLRTYLSQTFT